MTVASHASHPILRRTLTIGKQRIAVGDLSDASAAYQDARDFCGLGASEFPEGRVFEGDRLIARVSYNGRVWAPTAWREGDLPLVEAA